MINELRIGNWYFDGEQYVQVTGIHGGKLYNKYGWGIISEDNPLPITLTPKILEKMTGCDCISDSPYRTTWDIDYGFGRYIHLVHHKVDKGWEVTFVNSIVLRSPHLHILQNVIFFNWGKELEITL